MGLPRLAQQSLIISDREIELAKRCVLYLIQKIKDFKIGSNNGVNAESVWIPYSQILANVLVAEKGTDNRITKRIFSFLRIITLSRCHLRGRLRYGPENLVIADLEDLDEALHITQNVSGIPTYKLKLFKEIFLTDLSYTPKIMIGFVYASLLINTRKPNKSMYIFPMP